MRGIVRLFIALLLIALAACAVALPAWGLYNNLRAGSDQLDEYGIGDTLIPGPGAYESRKFALQPGAGSPIPENWEGPASLTIELVSIVPASVTANLTARFNMYSDILSEISGSNGRPPKNYKKRIGELIIGDNKFELPLERFTQQEGITRSIQLEMYANPSRYPNDWYRLLVGEVVLGLPEGLYYKKLPFVPVSVGLVASPSMEGKVIEFMFEKYLSTRNFTEVRSEQIETLDILVKREPNAKMFVWTMALTPMLLLLVALSQILKNVDREADSATRTFVSLELAIAVLAILPLRQVLVPSDIQGLTTVDFLLGTQLAAFIALVAVHHALTGRQNTSSKPHSGETMSRQS